MQKQGRVPPTYPESHVKALEARIGELENELAEVQAVASELADENEVIKGKLHDTTPKRPASSGHASKEQSVES